MVDLNAEIAKTYKMYTGVLSGSDTNSGDRILVFAGLSAVAGLIWLPGYWKLAPAFVAFMIYRLASQI